MRLLKYTSISHIKFRKLLLETLEIPEEVKYPRVAAGETRAAIVGVGEGESQEVAVVGSFRERRVSFRYHRPHQPAGV